MSNETAITLVRVIGFVIGIAAIVAGFSANDFKRSRYELRSKPTPGRLARTIFIGIGVVVTCACVVAESDYPPNARQPHGLVLLSSLEK